MTITTVPLSTVFTAPASCSTSWTYEASTYNGITSGILLQNAVAVLLDTECFPPGFEQAGRIFLDQIFSPGACPQGYVTQSPLLVNSGTSTATCCSQDFSYYTDSSGYQGCLSTYRGETSLAARAGGFGQADTTTSTSLSGTYAMWGVPLTVEFQADQLSLYTTTTSSVFSTTSTSPTTNSVSQPTSLSPTQTPSPSPASSGGISTGAKAGIAVGIVVGVLILLGIAILAWRRRRGISGNKDSNAVIHEADGGFQYKHGSRYQDIPIELGTGEHRTQAGQSGGHQLNEMPT